MTGNLKHSHVEVPQSMRHLPVTSKGYIKPWFVKGNDFRVVDDAKAIKSITKKVCWISGKKIQRQRYAIVGGPLTAHFRISSEPPCSVECAEYAVQVCPFILYPNAKRREAGLSEDQLTAAHNEQRTHKMDDENPGEYYIVVVRRYRFVPEQGIITYDEEDVIERQYWVGGERQAEHTVPIATPEMIRESQRRVEGK